MLVPRVYGLGDLSQILDDRAYTQARTILETMREDLAKVVVTDAYRKSVEAIDEHGFVLLIGEPAAGKTTIASLLAMAALDQWNVSTLKLDDPGEVAVRWNPNEPQFFWLDDAFGVTQYEDFLVHRWNHILPQIRPMLQNGAKIVMTSRDYIYNRDFETMILGLDQYCRTLRGTTRDVRILYHDNLHVSASGIEVRAKEVIRRNLSDFQRYRDFLSESLVQCAENMSDIRRKRPLQWLGTISTGFDSPTVAALARPAGLEDAITVTSARGGGGDSGRRIGEKLGLNVTELERDQWQRRPLSEVPFLAADAKGEDVYLAAAEGMLRGRVLLTGYAAGAWARRTKPLTELSRADQSGLSLTEYRLWAGFLNLAVPTMGLRSGGDIYMVNLSTDMTPWSTGQSYDKPFCRRVLTEAEIDPDWFGTEKKAASVLMFDRRRFLSAGSLQDFQSQFETLARRHRVRVGSRRLAVGARVLAGQTALRLATVVPGSFPNRIRNSVRVNETAYRSTRYDYLYAWATQHAVERYRHNIPSNISDTGVTS